MTIQNVDSFDAWVRHVNELLVREYFISTADAGLSESQMQKYFGLDMEPPEFVQWFAVKYDLESFRYF